MQRRHFVRMSLTVMLVVSSPFPPETNTGVKHGSHLKWWEKSAVFYPETTEKEYESYQLSAKTNPFCEIWLGAVFVLRDNLVRFFFFFFFAGSSPHYLGKRWTHVSLSFHRTQQHFCQTLPTFRVSRDFSLDTVHEKYFQIRVILFSPLRWF